MTITSQNKNRASSSSYWLYAGAAFLAFAPCLVGGQAYFANDLSQYFYHNQVFLKNQLLSGHFPLWNPYLFGGQPFFANPNTMMCYPLNYLILLFPVPYGFSVFFFLHMLIASFGMHFWLKSLRLSENACSLGALLFPLSGYFWWQLIEPLLLTGFAWSPLFFGCLERVLETRRPRWIFLTGLCFALIFCCGNFQSATYVFYSGLAYFLLLFFRGKNFPKSKKTKRAAFPWKKAAMAAFLALWGCLPLLVQLIPAHEFFRSSYRSNPVLNYDNFNATFPMSPRSTYQFLFPFLGVPDGTTMEEAIVKFSDQDPYKDNGFVGVMGNLGVWAPFLLAMAFWRKEKKRVYGMAFLGLAAVLSAWGPHFPLHRLECLILPWISLSRAPVRMLQVYVLFAAALAALGYQNMEQRFSEKKSASALVLGGGLYFLVLFSGALIRPGQTWREIVALVLGILGIFLWALPGKLKNLGRRVFLTSLVVPLLLSDWSGLSRGPVSNFDFESKFPALTYLKQKGPGGRYLFDTDLVYRAQGRNQSFTEPLPRNVSQDLGIRSTGGNDGFFLQKNFDLTRLPAGVYIQLMAVRGLVWKTPMPQSTEIIHHSFPGCEVYEPISPPPLVTAPGQVKFVSGDPETLEAMKTPGFDPARQIILSEPLPASIAARLSGKQAVLDYSFVKDETDNQLFKVRLDKDSLVAFSEIMFPGWKVWVDGGPQPLLTGNHAFRTLFVPAGEHLIEFRFEPVWFKPLQAGLLLWLVSTIGYGWFRLRAKPHHRPRSSHA